MRKTRFKKVFAAITLLTLAMGTASTVSARDATGSSLAIEKKLNVSGLHSYINTEFELDINAASAKGSNVGLNETNAYAGLDNGLKADNAVVNGRFRGNTTSEYTLTADASVFSKPGVYHYTLSEVENETDGVVTEQKTYDVYLYVVNSNSGDGSLEVNDIVIYSPDGATKIQSLTGSYTTKYFTLKKTITGNAADLTRKWGFTINITGQSGDVFTVVQDGVENQIEIASGKTSTSVAVKLGKDDEVTIYGLSAGDTYSITEDEANSDGYTTTIASGSASGAASDNTVIFNNNKETIVAAGISSDGGSGIIIASLGVGFIVLIVALRRKNFTTDKNSIRR